MFMCLFSIALSGWARADAKYDWARLSGVQKVGYVNPYFVPNVRGQDSGLSGAEEIKRREHESILRTLRLTLQKSFIERMATQARFVIVPQAVIERELHKLHWGAADLFENKGIVKGKAWPEPDKAHIAIIANRIGVDALIIGCLREPASIGEGPRLHHEVWNANPLNITVKRMRAHVISPRVQAYMVTKEGWVVWKDEQMADHPRTNPRTSRTLIIDWTEVTSQVACQIADSLLRMPPPGR
jgi:hypothetical protein